MRPISSGDVGRSARKSGVTSDGPIQTQGIGRPNKLLIRDYSAPGSGWIFRVETDIPATESNQEFFKVIRSFLEGTDKGITPKEIVKLLHEQVDQMGTKAADPRLAKNMFSAAFGEPPV